MKYPINKNLKTLVVGESSVTLDYSNDYEDTIIWLKHSESEGAKIAEVKDLLRKAAKNAPPIGFRKAQNTTVNVSANRRGR